MISATNGPRSDKPAAGSRNQTAALDPLDLYLKESSAFPLLEIADQTDLLRRLIARRDAWQAAFLDSEPALEALWEDLAHWRCGDIAASSLVPGPPRLAAGQIGPVHHAERLYRIFEHHRKRQGSRPFRTRRGNPTQRLVRAVAFVGFRPRPLARYRDRALRDGDDGLRGRVDRAHREFLELRRQLVEHNLRLVLKVARQFFPGPLPLPDLVQEGNIGLIRATESFNLRFGVRFSTYAHLWIRQAIIRALEDKSRTIRLPVSVTQKLRRLQARDVQQGDLDEDEQQSLVQLLSNPTIGGPVLSLNGAADGDADALVEVVPDADPESPDSVLAEGDLRSKVQDSLALLPERPRLVVKLRFGLDGGRPHTLSEIGRLLGLSAERVRQIQEQAFDTMKTGPEGDLLEELVID